MGKKTARTSERSGKIVAASLAVGAVLAVTRPAFQAKVYATANTYEWEKQVDHDLMGGTFTSVASSADGTHLIVGSREGGEGYTSPSPLYVSDDSGATWENVTENAEAEVRHYWNSVDVTNDGVTMVAASDEAWDLNTFNPADGKIFISHNSGDTWSDITPDTYIHWSSVVIAGDGSKIVALADDDKDHIYLSTNGGTTWTTKSVANVWNWESLAISDDGGKILVGGENDDNASSLAYLSTNGGTTWTDVTPDEGHMVFTTRVAMSSSGGKLAVSTFGYNGSSNFNAVHISTNNGATWSDIGPDDAEIDEWNALGMSDDGNVIAVMDRNDVMMLSQDGGTTWNEEDPDAVDDGDNDWQAIDFNTDGSRVVTASQTYAYVGGSDAIGGGDEEESEEPTTVSFTSAETAKTIELTLPSGTTVTCHSPVKETGLSAQDGVFSYPVGLVDFCFSGADTSNDISLVFITELKPNEVVVRKFNPTTKQYATITGASVTETTLSGQHALRVTYTITDNGPLDTDPDTGEIADPVGLAVASVNAPNTGVPSVMDFLRKP